jgi:HPt (histidine-containing phosphotransfer) domain-containing protein
MSNYFENPRLISVEQKKLIPVFMEEITSDVRKLVLAINATDSQRCLELTHKISGTSISFGISILANKAELVRMSIQENSLERAAEELKGLRTVLIELQEEAKKMA